MNAAFSGLGNKVSRLRTRREVITIAGVALAGTVPSRVHGVLRRESAPGGNPGSPDLWGKEVCGGASDFVEGRLSHGGKYDPPRSRAHLSAGAWIRRRIYRCRLLHAESASACGTRAVGARTVSPLRDGVQRGACLPGFQRLCHQGLQLR